MAIIKLKDVEVTRVNSTGYGVQVAEKFEVKGQARQQRYTVWFKEPHGLVPGAVVSLSGFLGSKVSDPWTGNDGQERRSVELSVNNPRIEAGDGAGGGSGEGRSFRPQRHGDFRAGRCGREGMSPGRHARA